MVEFKVDESRCIQCEECVNDCPRSIIVMDGELPKITEEDKCYRCQHCFTVCPTGAISILGYDPDDSTELKTGMPNYEQMATMIKGRRSVRQYADEDLDSALIDTLLADAWHAPTGVNTQAVHFTVVKDRTTITAIRDEVIERLEAMDAEGKIGDDLAGKYLSMILSMWREKQYDLLFRGAPHMVLTSAPADAPCPVQDAHIALCAFELLAQAHGVGTVWDGIFMFVLNVFPDLVAKLGVPEGHTLGYAMAFGKPAVQFHRTCQRGPAPAHAVSWS